MIERVYVFFVSEIGSLSRSLSMTMMEPHTLTQQYEICMTRIFQKLQSLLSLSLSLTQHTMQFAMQSSSFKNSNLQSHTLRTPPPTTKDRQSDH